MGEIGCRSNQRDESGFYGTNCKCELIRHNLSQLCNSELEPDLEDLILNPKANKIPRPPNAFMIYAKEHRKLLASKHPKENNKNISTLLGEAWRKTDPCKKMQYFEKAKMLERMHKKRYPGYVYSPREARIQKQKRAKKRIANKHEAEAAQDELQSPESNKSLEESRNKDWASEDSKSSVPEYVPNNPHFFESQSLPKICENSSFPYESGNPSVYSRFPSPWQIPKEPPLLHYYRRPCEEYDMYSRMFPDYQRCPPSCSCNYEALNDREQFNRPSPENTFRSCSDSRCSCSSDYTTNEANQNSQESKVYATLTAREFEHQRPIPSMEPSPTVPPYPPPMPPHPYSQYRDYNPIFYSYPRPPWASYGYNPSTYYPTECLRGCCNPYRAPPPFGYPQYPSSSFGVPVSKHETEALDGIPSAESVSQEYETNDANSSDTEILGVDNVDEEENEMLQETKKNEEQVEEKKVFQQM